MSKTNQPKLSELPPLEQMDVLRKEIEKAQYTDPGYAQELEWMHSDAYERYQNEVQFEQDHMVLGVDYVYATSEDIAENKKRHEEKSRIEANRSADLSLPDQTAKQVDEIHTALLGSIKPKQQNKTERIKQMTAQKLAQGAIKIRKEK